MSINFSEITFKKLTSKANILAASVLPFSPGKLLFNSALIYNKRIVLAA